MDEKDKIVEEIIETHEDELSEEAVNELSNGLGDDE